MRWFILILILIGGMVVVFANPFQIQKFEEIGSKSLLGFIMASEGQPEGSGAVGFREINGSWHMWNEENDYYFNASNGIQLTNHYEDYWTKNIFCGIATVGSEEREKCLDLGEFTWTNYTNNETIAWLYGKYTVLNSYFWINYSLENYDQSLSIDVGFVNNNFNVINNSKIKFLWKIIEIDIPYSYTSDNIFVEDVMYNLTDNVILNNTDSFYIMDSSTGEHLIITYDNSSQLEIKTNVSILLPFNQSYHFTWIDARCSWSCQLPTPPANFNTSVPETFEMDAYWTGIGDCPSSSIINATYCNTTSCTYVQMNDYTELSVSTVQDFNPQSKSMDTNATWEVTASVAGNYTLQAHCINDLGEKISLQSVQVNVSPIDEPKCTYQQISTSQTLSSNSIYCYNITTDNVVFDCNNYYLDRNCVGCEYPHGYWALWVNNVDNITIKNCNINYHSSGIYLANSSNSTIQNTNITNTLDDYPGDVAAYGIYLNSSINTTLHNIKIEHIKTNSTLGVGSCYTGECFGIYSLLSNNTNLSSIYIEDSNGSYLGDKYLDSVGCQSGYISIGIGIQLENSYNNTGSNITIFDTFETGFQLFKSNLTSKYDNISFTKYGYSNYIGELNETKGIFWNNYNFNIYSFSSNNNHFYDCDINKSTIGLHSSYVYWYNSVWVNITNSSKLPITDVNITINGSAGWMQSAFDTTTNSSGLTQQYHSLEFLKVCSYEELPYTEGCVSDGFCWYCNTPFNITANLSGYTQNWTVQNITQPTVIDLQLFLSGTPPENCWTLGDGLLTIPYGCTYYESSMEEI